MTKIEYSEYVGRFRIFMKKEGLSTLTTMPNSEPYFSWNRCDCCGLSSATMEDCCGFNRETWEIQDGYRICEDCIHFSEYGSLGDKAMMEIGGEG